MDCKNCIKEDVCDQKDILREIRSRINEVSIDGHLLKSIALTKGITVEIHCIRAVKKQTEFSPGWTTANTKNL